MKNTPIRILIVMGALTMAGILFTQIHWVSKAINSQEEQFNHSVQMALRNVVESLCAINGNDVPSNDPIDQVSNNYFIARTNKKIDLKSLDYLIIGEFQKRNIDLDFEYGVYDCQTDRMVYGDLISMNGNTPLHSSGNLPRLEKDEYYFGVYFPSKTAGIVNQLGFWKFTTILTILILFFFGYALFVILRQKRLSEIQRDFVNNITHELKTPLATLKVSSEFLKQSSKDEKNRKYASIVFDETIRLEKHVEQLLKTSFIEQISSKKLEKVEAVKILKDVIQCFQEDSTLEIRLNLEPRKAFIKGQESILENVFFNLMDNAKKYGDGSIIVDMKLLGKKLEIAFGNKGMIEEREQTKIFKKFYRVSNGNIHNAKGFGLGLYFVKKATNLMKGKVSVRCKEGETCFIVTLPIYE